MTLRTLRLKSILFSDFYLQIVGPTEDLPGPVKTSGCHHTPLPVSELALNLLIKLPNEEIRRMQKRTKCVQHGRTASSSEEADDQIISCCIICSKQLCKAEERKPVSEVIKTYHATLKQIDCTKIMQARLTLTVYKY